MILYKVDRGYRKWTKFEMLFFFQIEIHTSDCLQMHSEMLLRPFSEMLLDSKTEFSENVNNT